MMPNPAVIPQRSKLNVVLFSGGSGTQTITDAFLKHGQIALTILINAYDDGLSTGRLRRFIPGMLGPSDVRKNINRLMPRTQDCHLALRALSDYRLPVGAPYDEAMSLVRAIAGDHASSLPHAIAPNFDRLTVAQARTFREFFGCFLQFAVESERRGTPFDFTDCALGNLLFAGCFLREQRDFNRAIDAFAAFYEIEAKLLNVTQGENLFLVARKEDGSFLYSEAEIVSAQNIARIDDIVLIDERIYRANIENGQTLPAQSLESFIAQGARTPSINPAAEAALRTADVIVYGPGTQHSSLFPSYLTRGVAEAIVANEYADKIFISNIRRDFDIQQDNANDLARKFLEAMSRKGEMPLSWKDAVTHFFFQGPDESSNAEAGYVEFDEATFQFPLHTVKLRDWESQDGQHAGGYVLDELRQIVQSRIEIALQPFHHLVSIVVPALDEERTVEETLKRLAALDFQTLGLSKEIIFVDGGSTDRTLEIASSVRSVKAYRMKYSWGRGAALRFGIEKARGDVIVFFPADLEYFEQDLYPVVRAVASGDFKAVFGTRAVKCTDLSGRLKSIYGKHRGLYVVSKYGGMLLSTLTLFLYNRYVTDTLTSIKGFDATFLRSLRLESDGMNLDAEIVAKTCRRGTYILEIPVEYKARTKAEGKKSTPMDGIKALFSLVKYRFGRA